MDDLGEAPPTAERHPQGTSCPATPPLPRGTVVARVFGRACDAGGKPVADTLRQELYVEDRFQIPLGMQEALAVAGAEPFRVPEELARLLVSHAYLGQLDVNPVDAPGGTGELKLCDFRARRVDAEGGRSSWIRIEGRSEAAGATGDRDGSDGRRWQHEVKLIWDGWIETRERRITRLLLRARGSEKLRWDNAFQAFPGGVDVTHLPAGHPFDLATEVRYGIIGEPVPDAEAGPGGPVAQVPDEARRQLSEALGPPFRVFRDKVQEELKLSDEQKQKLEDRLQETVQDAMTFFPKLEGLKPEEREKELHSYRQKAQERLAAFLKETLKAEQLERLRQLELQQEGPFALGRPDVMAEVKLTDEQRQQFMTLVQEMQRRIEPLIKEAQTKGNPEEIRPKAQAIRKEYAARIESTLTASQKERWQEMLGKPFDSDD